MALFSGLLLASDFDDTLLPTSRVRGAGAPPRSVSEENRAALAYFIAEGGRFTVSTGRSAATSPLQGEAETRPKEMGAGKIRFP